MTKREKRFWKHKMNCTSVEFENGNISELYLNLILPDLTDEELAYLCPFMSKVEELNLTDTRITDDGVSLLADLPNLQYLRLKDTRITALCLPHILKIPKLNHIHLGSINANCTDLIPLSQIDTLQTIVARPNDFNKDALNKLLHEKPNLELIINGNLIALKHTNNELL